MALAPPTRDSTSSEEYPSVAEVEEVCRWTSGLLEYGAGPVIESGRNPCEAEILAYGEGHCGMYAYLFAKELSRRQIPCTAFGITSSYLNWSQAIHMVVQVDTDQGTYVFDPTYGNYYEADLATLCAGNGEVYLIGAPSEETYYQTSRFFAEVQMIEIYPDLRDYYDLDLGKNFPRQTLANLALCPEPVDIRYAEELEPNTVKTTFQEEVEFYRVRMEFVDPVPEDATFTCTVTRADGTVEEVEGFVQQDIYQVNFQAFEQTDALEVEMRIACAQTLPELIQYTIYQ